jgi:quercetin dioxygenase-like cupin family protein
MRTIVFSYRSLIERSEPLSEELAVTQPSHAAIAWDRFENIPPFSPAPSIWMRSLAGDQLMLNLVTIEPGGVVPEHSHLNEQAGYVVRGTLILTIEGETRHLGAGDCYLAPANVVHSGATTDEGCDVLDVFAPPRPDYVDAAAQARRQAATS